MLSLTKRQMKAIANFCLNSYGEGAAFFGNRIEASDGIEAKDETHFGSKERNLYMCGDSELYHVEVAMIGIDPTETKREE